MTTNRARAVVYVFCRTSRAPAQEGYIGNPHQRHPQEFKTLLGSRLCAQLVPRGESGVSGRLHGPKGVDDVRRVALLGHLELSQDSAPLKEGGEARRGGAAGAEGAARGAGIGGRTVQAADRGQQERRDVVGAPTVVPVPMKDEQANPTVEALAALRA